VPKIAARVHADEYDLVLFDVLLPEGDRRSNPPSSSDHVAWVTECLGLAADKFSANSGSSVRLKHRVQSPVDKQRPRLREIVYLREVARANEAAIVSEVAELDLASVDSLAQHDDALGRLARVFQRTIGEVRAREASLRREVQQLRIEIDTVKRDQELDKITNSDYFRRVRQQAREWRAAN